MKIALFICCILSVVISPVAYAGITGTYKIKGSEYDNGQKYTFTGTASITKISGKYALKFNDGDKASYAFSFAKPLNETKAKQSVNYSSSLGTGNATFSYAKGKYKVTFTYQAKSADVRGSGSGSK